MDALLLAETLAARLCHDLSGTANALMGAVEELRDVPDDPAEALALAQDAGDALIGRLRLLRAAWGRGGPPMDFTQWQELAAGAIRSSQRLDLDGMLRPPGFSSEAARLMLNLVMLACEALPAGGVVELAGHPAQDVMVRIVGPRAAWPPGLAAMLADPAEALPAMTGAGQPGTPRMLQAAMTALVAHASGQRVSMLMGPPDVVPPLLVRLAPLN